MTATVVAGHRWQDVLGHRLELADPPTASSGAVPVWDVAKWDVAQWGDGWAPTFRDVTPHALSIHSTTGAQGLELSPGVGSIELELLDLDGILTPTGSTDWLLGLHVRGFVTPAGRTETAAFYGIVDAASSGGTFAIPTVKITAYDIRSIVGAAATVAPVANTPQSAHDRLVATLGAAGIPAAQYVLEADSTVLLADDTLELGDLFGRTVESAGGLAWATGDGHIAYRNADWIHGASPDVAAYIYAGTPPAAPPPAVPVAQSSNDLDASQALSNVRNVITYENTDDPPVSVTVTDTASINRYGLRSGKTTDLAGDVGLLGILADRELARRKAPPLLCEAATVAVYDKDTAAIASTAIGSVVVVGRNDPGVAVWELIGIVAGVELSLSAESAEVAVTVTTAAGIGGGPGSWDHAVWDSHRWV